MSKRGGKHDDPKLQVALCMILREIFVFVLVPVAPRLLFDYLVRIEMPIFPVCV